MTITYHYDQARHACIFKAPSETNGKGFRDFKCEIASGLTWLEFQPYARTLAKHCKSERPDTIIGLVEVLKQQQRYIESDTIYLPTNVDEWDEFIMGHFEFTLDYLGPKGTRNPNSRIAKWSATALFYRRLKSDSVVPLDVYVPPARLLDSNIEPEISQPLGKLTEQITSNTGAWHKQSLVSRDLCLDEDEFLSRISNSLVHAIDATTTGCIEYFDKLKRAHTLGRKLISRVNRGDLISRIKNNNFYCNGKHVADPTSEDGLSWFLAAALYYLTETPHLNAISFVSFSKIAFFKDITKKAGQRKLTKLISDQIGELGIQTTNINENLSRLLGQISARDCAAAASILIIDQPKFTSMGIQSAKIVLSNGKPAIETQVDDTSLLFTVEKPRADKYQSELLSTRSAEIFIYIVECTKLIRAKLKKAKDPKHRFLFLTATRDGILCPGNIDNIMQANGHTLYDEIAHHLEGRNIDRETFSLGSLRVTQGLITYFHTGSLYAVSRKLGNAKQTVKSSYIPDWVQERRYIWLIRAFQAKLVLLATVNKPWHFSASDFLTESDLKRFISQQLSKNKRTDAFSQHFRKEFSTADLGRSNIFSIANASLAFSIDEKSLSALYILTDRAAKTMTPEELEKFDPELQTSMGSLIDLRSLISTAAEGKFSSEADKMLAAALHQGSRLELNMTHNAALRHAAEDLGKEIHLRRTVNTNGHP
ncbi:hypothetical protein [Pseudomonas fluorescens]|uniref:Uncharacterized protein n=1 Tax=Pseudomonas fluorescens TaxID=294 RepID=A0A5E7G476_PSEFL|nr:hypothetical protein [Pseudomonas fluorescens]VVO45247.1 hypothetical protein PS833_06631 [Pseudomonas fluorescens]